MEIQPNVHGCLGVSCFIDAKRSPLQVAITNGLFDMA